MLRLLTLLTFLCFASLPISAHEATTDGVTLRSLGYEDVRVTSQMNFDVERRPTEEPWVEDIVTRANAARSVVNKATGDALLSRIKIIITPDKETFLKLVGGWAENSAAVAVPSQRTMIINGDVMRAGPPGDLGTTLVHELAHLYFGVHSPRSLPRWLDEGLAQIIASQGTAEVMGTLTWAKWLRGLIPLRSLERSFPVEGNRQRLAYMQSLSLARFLVREDYSNSVWKMVDELTGPAAADEIAQYWDPLTRDALEIRWKKDIGTGWGWMTLTLSSGLFWGIAAALTVAAWLLIRRRNRGMRAEWAEEEKIYEALDEEEARIYGDDEDELVYRDEHELNALEDWEDGTGRGERPR